MALARLKDWAYPAEIKDVKDVDTYLQRHYEQHVEESVSRIEDFENLEINTLTVSDWTITSSFKPGSDAAVDLGAVGATDYRFRHLYLSGNLSDETNTLTVANAKAAYTHVSATGADHGYINQDVQSTASPTFNDLKTTDNIGVGISAWGTSAAKVLGIGGSTAPITSPADMVQLWSEDRPTGYAQLHYRAEGGVARPLVDSANVKDYGAVADDSNDDTAAIQTAADAAPRSLIFPPGNYKITKGINISWFTDIIGIGLPYIRPVGTQVTGLTGDITNGSRTVSDVQANTDDLSRGMMVAGAGIPVDTHIRSVDSASQITIDRDATATTGDVSLTFNDFIFKGARNAADDTQPYRGKIDNFIFDFTSDATCGGIYLRQPYNYTWISRIVGNSCGSTFLKLGYYDPNIGDTISQHCYLEGLHCTSTSTRTVPLLHFIVHNATTLIQGKFNAGNAPGTLLSLSGSQNEIISTTFGDVTQTALTGDTSIGSAVITDIQANTTALIPEMIVAGTGIPANSRIVSVDSASQVTINNNATANGDDVALTFDSGGIVINGVVHDTTTKNNAIRTCLFENFDGAYAVQVIGNGTYPSNSNTITENALINGTDKVYLEYSSNDFIQNNDGATMGTGAASPYIFSHPTGTDTFALGRVAQSPFNVTLTGDIAFGWDDTTELAFYRATGAKTAKLLLYDSGGSLDVFAAGAIRFNPNNTSCAAFDASGILNLDNDLYLRNNNTIRFRNAANNAWLAALSIATDDKMYIGAGGVAITIDTSQNCTLAGTLDSLAATITGDVIATGSDTRKIALHKGSGVESAYLQLVDSGGGVAVNADSYIEMQPNNTGSWRFTAAGEAISSTQPAFLANNSATDVDVTGDNTAYILIFNEEIFDQGGDFDGTSTFTAPVTGKYLFEMCCVLIQLTNDTYEDVELRLTTSNNTYYSIGSGESYGLGGYLTIKFGVIADMDANDIATCTAKVFGGTKTVDVYGTAAPTLNTYFSGALLC